MYKGKRCAVLDAAALSVKEAKGPTYTITDTKVVDDNSLLDGTTVYKYFTIHFKLVWNTTQTDTFSRQEAHTTENDGSLGVQFGASGEIFEGAGQYNFGSASHTPEVNSSGKDTETSYQGALDMQIYVEIKSDSNGEGTYRLVRLSCPSCKKPLPRNSASPHNFYTKESMELAVKYNSKKFSIRRK